MGALGLARANVARTATKRQTQRGPVRFSAVCLSLLVGAPALAAPAAAVPLADPLRRTAVVDVAEAAAPSVVNIHADELIQTRVSSGDDFDAFLKDFTEPRYRQELTTTSLGSGVLIAPFHVVTNHHVVARAARVRITLSDRREFVTEVVGTDPELDLAVLKVKTETPLPFVKMGNSSDARVGETLVAIGNPFGLGHTVTTGVLSALHRTINAEDKTFHDFLQTDASINPGNSGGALLNLRGELIGINTAVYGRAQGIGFAIPVNRVRRIATDIIDHGEVRQGYLGVDLKRVTRKLAAEKGRLRPEGALVDEVVPSSPADRAGIDSGDLLFSVEGFPILTLGDFSTKMRDFTPGSTVAVELWRDGKIVSKTLTAEAIPETFAARVFDRQVGVRLTPLPTKKAKELGVDAATTVRIAFVRKKSAAEEAGLKEGDIITYVEDMEVKTPQLLLRAVLRARRSGGMEIRFLRDGDKRRARFRL